MVASFLVDLCRITMGFPSQDGSKAVLKGKPTSTSRNTLVKPHGRRGPIKKIAWDHGGLPSTDDKILELLHDFVNQFLSGGYNGMSFFLLSLFYVCLLSFLDISLWCYCITTMYTCVSVLMQSIREDIAKEHPAIQKNDVIVFFQVAQFVTSFQYHKSSVFKVRQANL